MFVKKKAKLKKPNINTMRRVKQTAAEKKQNKQGALLKSRVWLDKKTNNSVLQGCWIIREWGNKTVNLAD